MGAVALAAAVPAAGAMATSGDSATGGGQLFLRLAADPLAGERAYTTIAFSAVKTGPGTAAEGQVQEVDRTQVSGSSSIYHGEVFCMESVGTQAIIGYRPTADSAPQNEVYQLYVDDIGEGSDSDVLFLSRFDFSQRPPDAPPLDVCAWPTQKPDDPVLGRGNAQVSDGD